MHRQLTIAGRSPATIRNYLSYLAKIALRYHEVPVHLTTEQIHDYLYDTLAQRPSPSEAFFKLTVYSLRFAFRAMGMTDRLVELPKIAHEKRLPVVLNREEIRKMLELCTNPKHRLIMELLYGCGLRNSEMRNLQRGDLDFERRTLHVRGGKGRKDRYVAMGERLSRSLSDYLAHHANDHFVFTAQMSRRGANGQYSVKGLQWIIRHAAVKAGIAKRVSVHTLRHTYATHLLDHGLDILTIKHLLGHADINNTLIYLHVSQLGRKPPFGPLDRLDAESIPLRHCPFVHACP